MSIANQNFTPLFQKGEKIEIYGARNFNFYVLILILMFTFCSIGGANLALSDLGDKMNDPFVNLLSVDVPLSKRDIVEDLKRQLNDDSVKQAYKFESVTNYVEFALAFQGPETSKWVKGRSIDLNNPVLARLLEEDNLIAGSGFKMENEIGLIISVRLLEELGYEGYPSHIDMRFNELRVPIPIRAIVRELPELNYFVASPYFFFQRTQLGGTAFMVRTNTKLGLFLPDPERARDFTSELENFFSENSKYRGWDAEVLFRNNIESHLPGTEYTIEFFGYRAEESTDYNQLIRDLKEAIPEYDFIRYYDYDFNNYPSNFRIDTDKIAINFTELDRVRDFQEFLFNAYQIEVDIAKVRDKENFSFVKLLTEVISMLLIVFAIVSICFYLYNLLKSHLQKIRPNLGTFMAFGLDQKHLFNLYKNLLLRFLFEATLFSLIGAFVLLFVVSMLLGMVDNYLALFDWKLLATLIILFTAFYTIFKNVIETILEKTPGDLIYDR